MTVTIMMQAEVGDLPSFHDPRAGRENVFDAITELRSNIIHKKIVHAMSKKKKRDENDEDLSQEALVDEILDEESTLIDRLLESLVMDYTQPTTTT